MNFPLIGGMTVIYPVKNTLLPLFAILVFRSILPAQHTLRTITDVPPGIPVAITIDLPWVKTAGVQFPGSTDTLALQHFRDKTWMLIAEDTLISMSEFNIITSELPEHVQFTSHPDSVVAWVNDRPVFVYKTRTQLPPAGQPDYYRRGGFIHPAYSPAGGILTDDFPDGHMHQHGIFAAWVNTTFEGNPTDFWNQQNTTGTVLFEEVVSAENGPVFGKLITRQTHVAIRGTDTIPVLRETWTIRVFNSTENFMWDIYIEQENISDSPLDILPYHYGGMAFRGSREWNDTTLTRDVERSGPGKGTFMTSLGDTRLDGNHTRPEWTTMLGIVSGRRGSLTVIQHPDNPEYPQFVRIHPRMPYFCYLPVVEKGMILKPGEKYSSAYRVVTSSTIPDRNVFDQISEHFRQFPVK